MRAFLAWCYGLTLLLALWNVGTLCITIPLLFLITVGVLTLIG